MASCCGCSFGVFSARHKGQGNRSGGLSNRRGEGSFALWGEMIWYSILSHRLGDPKFLFLSFFHHHEPWSFGQREKQKQLLWFGHGRDSFLRKFPKEHKVSKGKKKGNAKIYNFTFVKWSPPTKVIRWLMMKCMRNGVHYLNQYFLPEAVHRNQADCFSCCIKSL